MSRFYPFLLNTQTFNCFKVTSFPANPVSSPGLGLRRHCYFFPASEPSTTDRTHLLIDSPEQKDYVQPLEKIEDIEKIEPKKQEIKPPPGQESLLMDGRGSKKNDKVEIPKIDPIQNTETSPSLSQKAVESSDQESTSDEDVGKEILTPKPVSPKEFKRLLDQSNNTKEVDSSPEKKKKKRKKLNTYQFSLV